jgi:hypothetical protein
VVARQVNIDHHLSFDGTVYSVPYLLTGELVEVRSTATTVEIFHNSQRVASHLRVRTRGFGNKSGTPAEVSRGASGMDALAYGALGGNYKAIHSSII